MTRMYVIELVLATTTALLIRVCRKVLMAEKAFTVLWFKTNCYSQLSSLAEVQKAGFLFTKP